jgi:peptidoglycan/LPS O-acetylase OafA/YrhL
MSLIRTSLCWAATLNESLRGVVVPSGLIVPSTLPVHAAGRTTTGATRTRRLDIQGLRAVAVLMVVAFHSGLPVPGGFVGVDVFFVISGFVITSMLMREWATTGRIRFGRFYVRRFKRLTPALALMVSVTVAISVLVLSPFGTQQTTAKTGLGAALLSANIVIARTTGGYFDAAAGTNPLLHAWSLSVEEQFYLAFPLALVIGWVLTRRFRLLKAAPLLIVACIGTASFAIAVVTSLGYAVPSVLRLLTGFYGPVTRAWEFAVGALLALAASRIPVLSKRTGLALALLGAGLLAASLWLITGDTPFPGIATLLPITGTLLLIQVGAASDNLVSRALTTRHMVTPGLLT